MSKTFINKFIFVFLVSMMVSPIQVQSCKYLMRGTMSLSSDWSLQSFFSLGTSKVQFHSNLLILSWGHKGWKDLIFWALIVVSDWLFQQTFPSLSNDYLTDHIEGLNCKLFQEIAKMYLQNMFVVDDSILDFSHLNSLSYHSEFENTMTCSGMDSETGCSKKVRLQIGTVCCFWNSIGCIQVPSWLFETRNLLNFEQLDWLKTGTKESPHKTKFRRHTFLISWNDFKNQPHLQAFWGK